MEICGDLKIINENMYKALLEDGEVKTMTKRIVKKFVKSNQNGIYNLSTLYSYQEERLII